MDFKDFIAKQLIRKKLHFKCDCLIPMDFHGVIIDYEIINNEIVFIVKTNDNRLIKIGENHPNLNIIEL